MKLTCRNTEIAYETRGEGTPVFMIHGWSVDHRIMLGCMEPVFSTMPAGWKRIYIDLPGMGASPAQPWIKNSDVMLEILEEFLDQLIPDEHFVLAGESYGGYLARGLLKQRFGSIDGLLLLCPSIFPGQQQREVPPFTVFERDQDLLRSLSREERELFESLNVIQNTRVWSRYKEEILPAIKSADWNFLSTVLDGVFSYDVDTLETPFEKPTLMLMGRQDISVGYRDQFSIIEHFPRASFVVLDKAGHNLQIEQDHLFSELVKEWLQRVAEEIGMMD